MGDLVEHGETDLCAQFFEIRKAVAQRLAEDGDFVRKQRRVQSRSLRQWHALINSEQRIAARIEPFGNQQGRSRSLFDDEFDIAQLRAEVTRQSVDLAPNFFSDFAMIQQSGFSPK